MKGNIIPRPKRLTARTIGDSSFVFLSDFDIRDYGFVDTPQLYWYQGALLARIDKKCAPVHVPDDAREPDDEKLTETDQN